MAERFADRPLELIDTTPGLEPEASAACTDQPPDVRVVPAVRQQADPQVDPPLPRTYANHSFVARYAAVWAFGDGDPARTSEPYYRHFIRVATAEAVSPIDILDVGCGPGRLIADLAEAFPSARCTGVDASPIMIDMARQILHPPRGRVHGVDLSDFGFDPVGIPARGRPDITLECTSLERYHRSGRQHDMVIASHLLDRVTSPTTALATLAHLVDDDGLLVVSCAFNYSHRVQWSLRNAQDVADALIDLGFDIQHADDDVPYSERLDARGTTTHHRVALICARKRHRSSRTGPLQAPRKA